MSGCNESLTLQSVMESAERKLEKLKKCNATGVFSCGDVVGLLGTKKYFVALHNSYLAQTLKRARMESQYIQCISNESIIGDSRAGFPEALTESSGDEPFLTAKLASKC